MPLPFPRIQLLMAFVVPLAACSGSGDPSTSAGGTSSTPGGAAAGTGGNSTSGSAGRGATASGGAAGSPVAAGGSMGGANAAGGGANTGNGGANAGNSAVGGANGGDGGNGSGGSDSNGFCETRPGLAFCEDFEALPTGAIAAAPPWKVETVGDGGSVTVASDQPHSGQHALRVLGGGFSAFLVYQDAQVLPAPSGRFYLRAFMRLSAAMTSGHNTFIVGDKAASPGAGNALRLGEQNQMLMYTVSGDTHGALANENFYVDHVIGAALTATGWGCLEILVDSETPELRVWLDGAEVNDLHHTDFPVDPYDALRFGFEKYAGPESEIFYDDLAIGSEPIGCN